MSFEADGTFEAKPLAWLSHADDVPVGTFHIGRCDWGASTRVDFISG